MMIPTGWKITRINKFPFKGIEVIAPNGYAAMTYSHDANPSIVLYGLADALLKEQPVPDATLQWIKTSEQMPKSGQVVLAYHKNEAGLGRRIRATWVAAKTEEASVESDFGEYDEEDDCFYAPEGWYEQMEHWPEYTACMVCGVEITHWMELPQEPVATSKGGA